DTDTRTVIFIDNAGFDSPEIYRPYLEQPNIDAVFYWDVFGDYAKYRGAIKWINGKPIISARIWMRNVNGQFVEPQQVADDINARPRNPLVPDGYSVIPVHAWSMSVSDVVQCASLLDPAVGVVPGHREQRGRRGWQHQCEAHCAVAQCLLDELRCRAVWSGRLVVRRWQRIRSDRRWRRIAPERSAIRRWQGRRCVQLRRHK